MSRRMKCGSAPRRRVLHVPIGHRPLLAVPFECQMAEEIRSLVVEARCSLPFSTYNLLKWRVLGLEILDCESFC